MQLNSSRGEVAAARAKAAPAAAIHGATSASQDMRGSPKTVPPSASVWADFVDGSPDRAEEAASCDSPARAGAQAEGNAQFVTEMPASTRHRAAGSAGRGRKRDRGGAGATQHQNISNTTQSADVPLHTAVTGTASRQTKVSRTDWQAPSAPAAAKPNAASHGAMPYSSRLKDGDTCQAKEVLEAETPHGAETCTQNPFESAHRNDLSGSNSPKGHSGEIWAPVAEDSAWGDFL